MRRASVRASIANFAALYGPMKGIAILPPSEPILIMRPWPWRRRGRNAWVTAICPITLTSSCLRISSIGRNSSGPATAIPALLMMPARPISPNAVVTTSTAEVIEAASVISSKMGVSVAEASHRKASLSISRRTPAKTRNPNLSSCKAHALPIPLDAPVTTIVLARGIRLFPIKVTSAHVMTCCQAAAFRETIDYHTVMCR